VRGGEGGGEGGEEEEGKGREGKEKGRGGRRGEGKGLPPYAIGTPHFLDQRYAPASWTSTPVLNLVALSLAGASPHICAKIYTNVSFLFVVLICFDFFFSGTRRDRTPFFTVDGSKDPNSSKDVPFGGQNNES